MGIARTAAGVGFAVIVAGCGTVPTYYTDRVAPSGNAQVATVAIPDPAPRAKRVQRSATGEGQTGRSEHGGGARPAVATPSRTPASDNTGTIASDTSSAEARAERERRAQIANERREQAIKQRLDSICRGC